MRSCLVTPCKLYRIAFVLALTSLLSAWTCSAIFNFNGCPGSVPQPQITSLTPDTIRANVASVLLTVDGIGFVPQSAILWNGSPLQTTFLDSRHLQATVTQQTFDSFGGSAGSSVLISVMSPAFTSVGCPNSGSSATLILVVN